MLNCIAKPGNEVNKIRIHFSTKENNNSMNEHQGI